MDVTLVVTALGAAFLGGCLQGLAGFGSTVVVLPLLSLVMDLRQAVPVCGLLLCCLNASLAFSLRRHLVIRPLCLLLAGALPGLAMGAWLLGLVPETGLKALLALAIGSFVWHSRRKTAGAPRAGTGYGLTAGILAGALSALLAMPGPPAVAYVTRLDLSRDAMRAVLTAFLLLAALGAVTAQATDGLVGGRAFTLAGLCLPALLGGVATGMALCRRLGQAAFLRVILATLGLTAIVLLVDVVRALARF